MKKKIIIVDDEPIIRMDLREILIEGDYNVVGEASDGFDAIELCKRYKPDLVLMDIKIPLLDGLKASKIIINEELAGCVVLLSAYSGREFIDQAKSIGVMGYVVKPIDEKSLLPAIEIALSRQEEMNNIKKDMKNAKSQLETRKKIEKAKGLLMKENNYSEEEAYNFIRKLSMDKRCSMKDIAEIIILNS